MTNTSTIEILRQAGWHESRQVEDRVSRWEQELAAKGGFTMSASARAFLLEFGGLAWPVPKTGERLISYSFNLDPAVAVYEDDRFHDAEAEIGETLFPLGEVLSSHFFLAITPSGKCFLVMDQVLPCGSNPWEAFDQLLSSPSTVR